MNIRNFIKRHPISIYYILTFTISWGGILFAVGGPGGIPGTPENFERMLPLLVLAMLAGPSIMGILMTGLAGGRAGLRDFLSRMFRWRAGVPWYAAALLLAPFLMTALPLAISFPFPEFLPRIFSADDKAPILRLGIAAGLSAGIFEELGWTGFAIPRLRLRYSVLATGLIVGFLWGAWHLLANIWSSGDSTGSLSLILFLHSFLFSVGILPAFRILMVWVYDRTGSLFLAMIMHFSLTAGNVILVPAAAGMPLVLWSIVIAGALWVMVAAVAVANGGQLSQKPS